MAVLSGIIFLFGRGLSGHMRSYTDEKFLMLLRCRGITAAAPDLRPVSFVLWRSPEQAAGAAIHGISAIPVDLVYAFHGEIHGIFVDPVHTAGGVVVNAGLRGNPVAI